MWDSGDVGHGGSFIILIPVFHTFFFFKSKILKNAESRCGFSFTVSRERLYPLSSAFNTIEMRNGS